MDVLTDEDIRVLKDMVARRTGRKGGGWRATVRKNEGWGPHEIALSAAKNDLRTALWTLERARNPEERARAEEWVGRVRSRIAALDG